MREVASRPIGALVSQAGLDARPEHSTTVKPKEAQKVRSSRTFPTESRRCDNCLANKRGKLNDFVAKRITNVRKLMRTS